MIAGVDIGGTKIAVGMVDTTGKVYEILERQTNPSHGFDHAIKQIISMIRESETKSGTSLKGVGIGCTGPVYPDSGTIGNVEFLPGWENAPIVNELQNTFNVPVTLENDADAAAYGEWKWGSGNNSKSFVYISIGTGIGGSMILDGNIYRGVDGSHPEIGHHSINHTGKQCFCGGTGCWETYASGTAMENWFKEQCEDSDKDLNIDAKTICESTSPLAITAVNRLGHYLGIGIANIVNLFSPDVIALGGGVMKKSSLFLPEIHKIVKLSCGYVPHEKIKIVPAELCGEQAISGAAAICMLRIKGE